MLAFVTAVRHPQTAYSYERVLQILEATLRSQGSQTDPDFCSIVVGNSLSEAKIHTPHIHYVEVDFPPPVPAPPVPLHLVKRDKGYKNLIGLIKAKKLGASHVMFVDADDLVSNRLAGLVHDQPNAYGWYINQGYRYYETKPNVLYLQNRFHEHCGSCGIVRTDLYEIPQYLSVSDSLEKLIEETNAQYIHDLFGSHRFFVSHFADKKTPLVPLPFRGAMYMTGHGENVYLKNMYPRWWFLRWRKANFHSIPLSKELAEEFTLPSEESI